VLKFGDKPDVALRIPVRQTYRPRWTRLPFPREHRCAGGGEEVSVPLFRSDGKRVAGMSRMSGREQQRMRLRSRVPARDEAENDERGGGRCRHRARRPIGRSATISFSATAFRCRSGCISTACAATLVITFCNFRLVHANAGPARPGIVGSRFAANEPIFRLSPGAVATLRAAGPSPASVSR